MKGRGSLSRLEALKAIYAPKFKEANRSRRITGKCLEVGCSLAWSRVRYVNGELRVTRTTCRRKKCPRESK
jgi:hypothetical protein